MCRYDWFCEESNLSPGVLKCYSVIGKLTNKAKTVCTRPKLFQRELEHLREALVKCKYPHWANNRVQSKYINSNLKDDSNNNSLQGNSSQTNANMDQAYNNAQQDAHNLNASREEAPSTRQKPNIRFVVITYTKGISESFKKICGKYGIQTYFKGNTTIKQLLMKPRDGDPKDQKCGVIYSYQCKDIACREEYIGETSRTLGRGIRNISNSLLAYMCTSNKQDTSLLPTISTS